MFIFFRWDTLYELYYRVNRLAMKAIKLSLNVHIFRWDTLYELYYRVEQEVHITEKIGWYEQDEVG